VRFRELSLTEGWRFRQAESSVGYARPNEPANLWREAKVPGCVHDDLVQNGVLADPFERSHEAGCQWIGERDWEYLLEFDWHPDPGLPGRKLRFEGLDTVCRIFLNGEEIAQHENFFLPLEVDVAERLRPGTNELVVRFESAERTGMDRRAAYFRAEGLAHETEWFDERAFVRKPGYMFGWDWGPRLVTCGIWKPVRLIEYRSRIVSFEVFSERLEGGSFRVRSHTHVEGEGRLRTTWDGREFEGDFEVEVSDPKLWWPIGEGEPHLYEASARLEDGPRESRRVGLRTIRLLREPDERGESFQFEVNGRRIFARGANWIPNDSFPSRVTPEEYREQVAACAALGMNMLRVWGGGLYEDEAFYDACDELGILVWQDFPFACSYYPCDGPSCNRIEEEARRQIRRLRGRASLAIWCGNNECDIMHFGGWATPEGRVERYFGDELFGEVLPRVCREEDPKRPYVRSSPIGRCEPELGFGDTHDWDVWHGRGDWTNYAASTSRFSSEFGFASACGEAAWKRAGIRMEGRTPEDPHVRWHDKTKKPWEVFRGMVELHYPPAKTLEDWIYYSQLNQRDALRFGIEHFRTAGWASGTLIWQFNDCWPVQSWAVQDYARELKPAGFELERLYAHVLLGMRIEEGEVVLCAANDAPDAIETAAELELMDMAGELLDRAVFPVRLEPGERIEIGRVPSGEENRHERVVCARLRGEPKSETWRTLEEPKAMRWQPARLRSRDGELVVEGLAYDLTLTGELLGGLPGTRAVTLANGGLPLRSPLPRGTRLRSLAGWSEVEE
jgi:beta-mannosidase